MIPIVTPTEMAAIDAAAPEPIEELVDRAGEAVAWAARRLLGGTYGRRVAVVAGKGNNGADGVAAGRRLRRWGARVTGFDAHTTTGRLDGFDLVIDAAYGTGFRGEFEPPAVGDARVLAVDVPSGVDALTGETHGALAADLTVSLAALKPGLLLGAGSELAGRVEVADIGLDTSSASSFLVTAADVERWLPRRRWDDHKWRRAVWVIAGSPGMTGAGSLCAEAAQRAGAGMVLCSTPGVAAADVDAPREAVQTSMRAEGWAAQVREHLHRFDAVVIGPGLGRSERDVTEIRELLVEAEVPIVLDADGLAALEGHTEVTRWRESVTVATPHDGEFARLLDGPVPADRFDAVRGFAQRSHVVTVLKGPTTLVADPRGHVYAVDSGTQRLATAGTGDVLAGVIGAVVGAEPDDRSETVAAAAWLHGQAARTAEPTGLVAGDLPAEIGRLLDTS